MGNLARCLVTLGMVSVAACGKPPEATIEVLPGPIIVVAEGATAERVLQLTPAPPAETVSFELEIDDDVKAMLDASVLGTTLRVTPRCNAIPRGVELARFVELRVAARGVTAAPVPITVEIHPDDGGACAPQVAAWIGECAPGQGPTTPPIRVPLIGGPQTLCVGVTLPDSDVERLWVTLSTTPAFELFDPRTLGSSAPDGRFEILNPAVVGEHFLWTHALTIEDALASFRGRLELEVDWHLADPATQPLADGNTRIELVVGEPGDAVIRMLSYVKGTEFAVGQARFQISHFERPNEVTCARATLGGAREDVLVVSSGLGEVVGPGEVVCGSSQFSFEIRPAINSAAMESVVLEARGCVPTACADPGNPTACCESTHTQIGEPVVVDIPVTSVAESGVPLRPEQPRACVSLDDDLWPEIVVATTTGTLVHANDAGRFSTSSTSLMDAAPTELLAFSWRPTSAEASTPILLGRFSGSLLVHRAQYVNGVLTWDDSTWSSLAGMTGQPMEAWVPVGPSRAGGASYLAMIGGPGADTAHLRCISPACNGIDLDIDLSNVPGVGGDGTKVKGIGVADADGDGMTELLVAIDSIPDLAGNALREVRVYMIDLVWTGFEIDPTAVPAPVLLHAPASLRLPFSWASVAFAALSAPPGLPEPVYGFVRGVVPAQSAVVELVPTGAASGAPYDDAVLDVFGRPHAVAGFGDALVVSTEIGVWEYRRAERTWIVSDPALALRSLGHEIQIAPAESRYGEGFHACVVKPGATPSMVFNSSVSGAIWTQLGVVVDRLSSPTPLPSSPP